MRPRFNVFLLSMLGAALLGPAAWMLSIPGTTRAASPIAVQSPALLVASLNLAMMTDPATITHELQAHEGLRQADVIFFQEVVRDDRVDIASELGRRLGRHVAFASPDSGRTRGGLAILSRLPLQDTRTHKLKAQNLVLRSRKRIALAVSVQTDLGEVRLINTHLDTRINPGERIHQLGPALEDAQFFDGPAVIGGDFNTNDMQWVSNIVPVPFPGWQASRVRILMESRGFSTPFVSRRATFDHLGMQLDWIFTNRLRAVSSGIQPIDFSDHHAIWAQLAR